MAEVTPTDRPKLVRYRCVIRFGGVFVLSLDSFSGGLGAFMKGQGQFFSFFFLRHIVSSVVKSVLYTVLAKYPSVNCTQHLKNSIITTGLEQASVFVKHKWTSVRYPKFWTYPTQKGELKSDVHEIEKKYHSSIGLWSLHVSEDETFDMTYFSSRQKQ